MSKNEFLHQPVSNFAPEISPAKTSLCFFVLSSAFFCSVIVEVEGCLLG